MERGKRALEEARRLPHVHEQTLGMASSPWQRFHYLFKPLKFIRLQDGEGVRQAKMRLLAMRKSFIRHHVLGGLLVLLGGFAGLVIRLDVGSG